MDVRTFMNHMNERRWFRSIVCLTPGILLLKISSRFGAPLEVRLFCHLLLASGVFIFLFWPKVSHALGYGQEDMAAQYEDDSLADGQEEAVPLSGMHDLIALYNGDQQLATKAMMVELELNPVMGAARAIDMAARRKLAELKVMAESPQSAN